MLGLATASTVSMAKSTPEHRCLIAGLMSPYVGWVGLATALNYRVWWVYYCNSVLAE
jgi:tryptophan-rich sensory protein